MRAVVRGLGTVPTVRCGYRDLDPADVEAIMARPGVRLAIRRAVTDRLASESFPLAVSLLEGVVSGAERARVHERIAAASKIADLVLASERHGSGLTPERPIAEMTTAELRAFVARAEAELGDRATPVNAQALRATDLDDGADIGSELGDMLS